MPVTASAETGGNIDLNAFRPAMDSRGYLTINASQTLGHKEVSFGLGALDWGHKLVGFTSGDATYAVDNVISATLIAAFGVHVGPLELELGASAPFTIMNGDRGPDSGIGDGNTNNDKAYKLDGQGLGSLGLHAKTRFLKTSRRPYVGLGVIASVYLPTASPKSKWLGENTVVPQVIGIVDKEFGRNGRLRLALNGGIRLRPTTTFTNDDPGKALAPTTGGRLTVGAELPFGVGIAYAIARQKFELVGEVFGTMPLGAAENYQPLETIGGVKLYLAKNSFLSLGGGRGLLPGKNGNPAFRAFIGIVFEPSIGDRDGDGFKDDVDKCPDEPEDYDEFEDEDGCPEPDNDRDGIVDEDDTCPNVPEDKDGFQDEDGCPEGDKNDRDGDGIKDDVDKCPDDPEDFDRFEDEDGCPEPDNDRDGIL
ncbi:MAG: OmpA family protein, partial [Deltaproteobacteria bacterium]|nr:OmpA family protein [Deltaproteobacteria bacterium]